MHRVAAVIVLAAMAALAWRLHGRGDAALRRFAVGLAAIGVWQLATGLSNVVLGWPLVAAVAHTGGAALLTVLLASLLARAHLRVPPRHTVRRAQRSRWARRRHHRRTHHGHVDLVHRPAPAPARGRAHRACASSTR